MSELLNPSDFDIQENDKLSFIKSSGVNISEAIHVDSIAFNETNNSRLQDDRVIDSSLVSGLQATATILIETTVQTIPENISVPIQPFFHAGVEKNVTNAALAAVVLPSNIQNQTNLVKIVPPSEEQIITMSAPPCPVGYRDPTYQERMSRHGLVGSQVTIFWDGDCVYFPAKVVAFDESTRCYRVVYLSDLGLNPRPEYDEDLANVNKTNLLWKIWCGTNNSSDVVRKTMPSRTCKPEPGSGVFSEIVPRTRVAVPDAKFTPYEHMCVEAVLAIAHKKGTSLQSIRKFILSTYDLGHMQTASFNKKTLDGVNSALANGRLERVNHSTYKVTNGEKLRRKQLVEMRKRKIQAEMRGETFGGVKLRVSGAHDKDAYELNIIGTAAEYDKNMRNMLINTRARRDKSLIEHIDVLRPFLPETNYFEKLDPVTGQVARVMPPPNSSVSNQSATEIQQFAGIAQNAALNGVPLVQQPPTLRANLHKHQIQGISWMAHMYRRGMPMILGDQMGLGKTIQTIGFFTWLQSVQKSPGPYLVIAPLSVLPNWIAEFERFAPTFRVVRFHGPKDERGRMKLEEMSNVSDFDAVVTTYETLVAEVNWIRRKYLWAAIVVDEGHRLKNEKSQLSEKLRTVPTLSRVILTGTPLQNNLRELWALLHYLAPDVFNSPTSERFVDGFDALRNQIDTGTLRLARRVLGLFMLRRLKDHVAITLPSRKEINILVPLTNMQMALYKHMLCALDGATIASVMEASATDDAIGAEVESSNFSNSMNITKKSSSAIQANTSNDVDWRRLMNLLLQLRKICNHTYLMPGVAPDPYVIGEDLIQGSGKLLMLDRMLPRLRADGHRVLLFSQFTSMLDILEDYCELRDLPFVRLDGETNRVQRRLDCRRYNAVGSPLFVFLISTRAGGLGLNLASADTVILYDSDWNPQVDLQAMERAHRIGQTKPVRVFRLVCNGSVEERMVNRAEKKLYLNAMVAEAGEEDIDEAGELVSKEGNVKEGFEQALGIDGAVMSKQELASLIRFGANAVISGANDAQINDAQLDHLLERKGRDLPQSQISGSENLKDAEDDSPDVAMQAVLRARMQNLKEIDLRQLGSTVYSRTTTNSVNLENDEINSGKRERKQRITMVDGHGTGYGGLIPILTSSFEFSEPATPAIQRSKAWTHQTWCALCGKGKRPETFVKCAHCPKIFHDYCLEEVGIAKGSTMFICPHHKCAECSRSTASAGGLLFRCKGCLTSYCEDCLPQDEVESLGRCKELEYLGYSSKQSYYIKCGTCCAADGLVPTGVDGDVQKRAASEKNTQIEGSMDVNNPTVLPSTTNLKVETLNLSSATREAVDTKNVKTDADAIVVEGSAPSSSVEQQDEDASEDEPQDEILLTQQLRVHWECLPDSDEERKREERARRAQRKKRKRDSMAKSGKRKHKIESDNEDSDSVDGNVGKFHRKASHGRASMADSEDSEDEVDEYFDSLDIGDSLSLDQALGIILGHPSYVALQAEYGETLQEGAAILSSICNKLSDGKYRNARGFAADVGYWLGQVIAASGGGAKSGGSGGRASKRAAEVNNLNADAAQHLNTVLTFFQHRVQGLLVI